MSEVQHHIYIFLNVRACKVKERIVSLKRRKLYQSIRMEHLLEEREKRKQNKITTRQTNKETAYQPNRHNKKKIEVKIKREKKQ